jgi:LemA protein
MMAEFKLTRIGIIAIVSVLILLLVILGMVLTYNSLVAKQQDVKRSWGNIEAAYQLRIDKIPQVQAAVNFSTSYERGLLENITELRTKWLSELGTDVNANVNTTQQLDTNINALLVAINENYPRLLSVTVIQDFISIIDETENIILAQRVFYNDAVASYNSAILGFPGSLFGFAEASYYQRGQ